MRHHLHIFTIMLLASITPWAKANADVFNDAGNWAKGAYEDTRDAASKVQKAAEKAAKDVQKSAEHIGKEIERQAKEAAKQAQQGIDQAADFMENFIENMDGAAKTCQEAISRLQGERDKLIEGIPYLPKNLEVMPGVPTDLFYKNQCRRYAQAGFTCGIYPYMGDIARAIATGEADTKKLAQYVNHEYKSSPCKSASVIDRPNCALILGIAKMSANSMNCVANVIADTVHSGGGKGIPDFSKYEKPICTKMGEISFSVAADKLALGATSGEQAKKLVKFAQLLRKALKMENLSENSEYIQDVCHKGPKNSSYNSPVAVDTYAGILDDNPGSNLTLLKDLSSNMCLDAYATSGFQGDRPVQIFGCHGHSNQRWTFHHVNTMPNNVYYITNGKYDDKCVEETSSGAVVMKKCNVSNKNQLFTHHHELRTITLVDSNGETTSQEASKPTGMLRNIGTNQCIGIDTTNLKNSIHLKGMDCSDEKLNGVFYVIDPDRNRLEVNPGAHLNVYSNPNAPACLSLDKHSRLETTGCSSASTELWSFHEVKLDGKTYNQLWNDHKGPKGCLTDKGRGKVYDVSACNKSNKSQLFEVTDHGQMKNLASGYCVKRPNEIGVGGHPTAHDCADNESRNEWYFLSKN